MKDKDKALEPLRELVPDFEAAKEAIDDSLYRNRK